MVFQGTPAPELDVEGWLNSRPLDSDDGRLLLDFWSSSCAHCVEKLRHLKDIHDRYDVKVVGIHSPETGFEEEREHLRKAVERYGIDYPVAHDLEKNTWESYSNYYSPRQVLVEDGEVKWHHMGDINGLEQRLAKTLGGATKGIKETRKFEEVSLGVMGRRTVNGGPNLKGVNEFSLPGTRKTGEVYLAGKWDRREEYIEPVGEAKLFVRHGGTLKVVADPGNSVKDITVKATEIQHGEDLREEGFARIKNPGVYSLLDSCEGEAVLHPEPGLKLYSVFQGE